MSAFHVRCRPFPLITACTAALLAVSSVGAQLAPPPLGGARTLVGVVADTSGTPLADVTVQLLKSTRRANTNQQGLFRFDSLPPGTYAVSARGVGLIAATQNVVVGPAGGSVAITMIRFLTSLPSMITTAERGGLSGVIGDTTYHALANVVVTAVGGSHVAKTDSMGAFWMPLKSGHYMIRLEREGFARQTVGVTIPDNEGRRIAAWLAPQDGETSHQEAQQLFDLGQRIMRVSPASSRFYSREDFTTQGIIDLQALVSRWSTGHITQDCMVTLKPSNDSVPVTSLTAADIEFVELYLPTKIGSVRGGTSINGHRTKFTTQTSVQPAAPAACGNVGLLVWLRN
jgi:hypothetical protein